MSPDDAQVADRLRRALGGRALQPYPDELPADGRIDAAVLVPLRLHPHPSITVVVRSPSLADHPGEVGFPGGKPEAQDVDLAATARREAQEELGLDEDRVEVLGPLTPVPVATSRFRLHAFVGLVVPEQGPWRLNSESREARDLLVSSLCDGALPYRGVAIRWAGVDFLSPYFVLDARTTLFGASACVMVEALQVLGPALGCALGAIEERAEAPWPWDQRREKFKPG